MMHCNTRPKAVERMLMHHTRHFLAPAETVDQVKPKANLHQVSPRDITVVCGSPTSSSDIKVLTLKFCGFQLGERLEELLGDSLSLSLSIYI